MNNLFINIHKYDDFITIINNNNYKIDKNLLKYFINKYHIDLRSLEYKK